MEVTTTELPGVLLITPKRWSDARGFFSETYSKRVLSEHGVHEEFVQDNHSLSTQPNVIRGLHYQLPPFAQMKLLRVIRGAVLDVAVDIRRDSPTFGKSLAVELSAENGRQILLPVGFAHGFRTLVANTEVVYKVSSDYSPSHERGIAWNDPALNIDWGLKPDAEVILSPRDRTHPALAEAPELAEVRPA